MTTVRQFFALLRKPAINTPRIELIDGVVTEKPDATPLRGRTHSQIAGRVGMFLHDHPIGDGLVSVDCYIPEDRYNTRRPDVSVVLFENDRGTDKDDYLPYMPDLVAEIIPAELAPGETPQIHPKMHFYIARGTRVAWVINPIAQHVIVLTPEGSRVLTTADTLDGGDTLPGFSVPVAVLFRPPASASAG